MRFLRGLADLVATLVLLVGLTSCLLFDDDSFESIASMLSIFPFEFMTRDMLGASSSSHFAFGSIA